MHRTILIKNNTCIAYSTVDIIILYVFLTILMVVSDDILTQDMCVCVMLWPVSPAESSLTRDWMGVREREREACVTNFLYSLFNYYYHFIFIFICGRSQVSIVQFLCRELWQCDLPSSTPHWHDAVFVTPNNLKQNKASFRQYQQFCWTYESLRYLKMETWQFLRWQTHKI